LIFALICNLFSKISSDIFFLLTCTDNKQKRYSIVNH
jgi:hypothetical protein